jgi:hypothetical protein
MNLATARAQGRKKEVGLRKTLGGLRSQLLRQFFSESFLVSLLSVLVAISIVWGVLPLFNTLTSKSFSLSNLVNQMNLRYLLIFTVLVSVLAGSYPALFLSRFAPITALREGHKSGGSGTPSFLREGLVVFQFGVTVVLLIVTQSIDRQVNFLSESRLRVDGDRIVNVPLRGNDVHESFAAFKNEILRNPAIASVTTSSHIPFTANKSGSYKLPGILGVTAVFESDYFVVDSDFARVFELRFITGRDFSIESPGDSREFLLNERAVKMLGVDPANVIVKQIEDPDWNASGKIVGVVEDFHYRSLHSPIGPLVMKMDPAFVRFMSIRVEPYAIKEALDMLAREWKAFFPSSPFVFSFMDDDFNRMYQAEGKMASLFRYFSLIAVLISCLGLLALVSFMVGQRTKEIGVRKVLGASEAQIVGLLSREFLRLVILAFLIAAPVALWAACRWLQDFTYRVEIQPKPFVW